MACSCAVGFCQGHRTGATGCEGHAQVSHRQHLCCGDITRAARRVIPYVILYVILWTHMHSGASCHLPYVGVKALAVCHILEQHLTSMQPSITKPEHGVGEDGGEGRGFQTKLVRRRHRSVCCKTVQCSQCMRGGTSCCPARKTHAAQQHLLPRGGLETGQGHCRQPAQVGHSTTVPHT